MIVSFQIFFEEIGNLVQWRNLYLSNEEDEWIFRNEEMIVSFSIFLKRLFKRWKNSEFDSIQDISYLSKRMIR